MHGSKAENHVFDHVNGCLNGRIAILWERSRGIGAQNRLRDIREMHTSRLINNNFPTEH